MLDPCMKGRLTKMYSTYHFCNHCLNLPNVAPLRLLIQKACDIREAKFSRRPVKDDYPDSPLIWSSPFLTSLLLKLASGVFFPPDMNFASMDKMELNENL